MFGVWLNGVRVDNAKLREMDSDDIILFYQSRLEKNAKNYGKHVYQLDLYDEAGYAKLVERLKAEFDN